MSQVDLSIDSRLAGCVQQVIDQREWIPVFFQDPVYSSEVAAESQGAVVFLYEEHWGSVWRAQGTDESSGCILVNELMEGK